MVKKASLRKINKYKVMRSLYHLDKTKKDLLVESNMHSFQLKDALENLLKFGDIEKVKNSDDSNISVKYRLTEKGKKKLAYYEYRYVMREKWIPPFEKGRWQRKYEFEIADIVLNSNYYKKEKNVY